MPTSLANANANENFFEIHLTPITMDKINTQDTAHTGEVVKQWVHFFIIGESEKMYIQYGNHYASRHKTRKSFTSRPYYTTLWHIPTERFILPQEHFLSYVHCCFIQ